MKYKYQVFENDKLKYEFIVPVIKYKKKKH